MKNLSPLNPVLALALLTFLAATGCNKEQASPTAPKPPTPVAVASAERTSFAQVTSKLDAGGELYMYLSTEQWLAGVSEKVGAFHGLLGAIPNVKDEDRQNFEKAFGIVTNLIHQSGIEDVSGVGMSSIARETNFYHSKLVLHHYPGKGSGFLWNLFGQKPHELDGLNLLPTTTAMATFGDLDASLLWSAIEQQVTQSGLPQANDLLKKLPETFEKTTGLKWDRVLASLGGEFGVAVMLDDTKVISIPVPGGGDQLQIPEPTLLIVAKVKDDTVFNRIDQALNQNAGQMIVKTDKPGLKMRTWPLPLPLPIQVRPTVAAAEGYLFIANTDAIIQEVLAVKAGQKPGLKSTQEFQRLAKDVPVQGNYFSFTSQRFGQTMLKVMTQALQKFADESGSKAPWQQALFTSPALAVSYMVAANTDEGWLVVGNGTQHAAKLLAVGAAVPVGMLAGIAVPNFIKARQSSQNNACISNLRQIHSAKQQWALENKKSESDTPSREDLTPFFPNKKFPVCPTGGSYTINRVGDPPECSQPGHELPR
jgi:hypothetical protein